MTSRRRQSDPAARGRFDDVRRLVVKVGSGVLAGTGRLDPRAVRRLAKGVTGQLDAGRQVVLVSSGAVASGFRELGLKRMPRTIVEKQAAAAVGQQRLMHRYAEAFAALGRGVGQVLLTADDLHHRPRFLNARHTLEALLHRGVVPIVNENDSVAYDEIKLGDNDNLSSLVASLVSADLLILLSTVDGVRTDRGRGDVISTIDDIDAARRHVTTSRSATGTGGMGTKLDAADLAARAGIPTVIADGRARDVLTRITSGRPVGTFVPARRRSAASRKRWIGYAARVRGTIVVDDGARRAIVKRGASLLPSGIVAVDGAFDAGATVEVRGEDGTTFARGIACYTAEEITRIRGRRTTEIAKVLGYAYSDEVLHRSDMVVVDPEDAR